MMTFAFLDKARFPEKARELFDLLYANMETIVPGEFVFEEWQSAVGDGLKSPKRQIVLMNDENGCLAGFFQYYVNDTTFMMEEIQIRPEYQRKYGLFRGLYSWLIPQFEKNPPYVEAFNHPQNQKSHGILNRLGLQIISEENGYRHYRGTFDALLNWLKQEKEQKNMLNLDFEAYFNQLFPGFFERESIKNLPESYIAEEMMMDLHTFSVEDHPLSCPEHITFGMYSGELEPLHAAVREVDESWVEYFHADSHVYCAFDGNKVVSFCILDGFGEYDGWKVGGPGCVGTIPSCRKQGIGLKMIQNATAILQADGYDISHIHYTGVAPWYAHLGYEVVLRWNGKGFVGK